MVDLQQFCPSWSYREWMEKPFSRDGHTWACDGKLLVRVPLRNDVPEHPRAADVMRIWPAQWPSVWRQPLRRELPAAEYVACDVCSGRGVKHKCPNCSCTCCECNGKGEFETVRVVRVGERALPLRHARLIVGLDWVEISPPLLEELLLCFRFEGGEGVVSLMRDGGEAVDVAGEI
jgi:hypothetical protein